MADRLPSWKAGLLTTAGRVLLTKKTFYYDPCFHVRCDLLAAVGTESDRQTSPRIRVAWQRHGVWQVVPCFLARSLPPARSWRIGNSQPHIPRLCASTLLGMAAPCGQFSHLDFPSSKGREQHHLNVSRFMFDRAWQWCQAIVLD